jgi:hypothetical protein
MDLVEGFSGYMRKYGGGRLAIDVPLITKLREQGRYQEAKDILEDVIASITRLGPNEDIVGGGMNVTALNTSGTAVAIADMKHSLEADIQVGLLQSPLTMGKTAGSTYASGNISEEDRYLVLESIQARFIQTLQTEIIDTQLAAFDYPKGSIILRVDRLDDPYMSPRDMMDAADRGYIQPSEWRVRSGFPKEMPEE